MTTDEVEKERVNYGNVYFRLQLIAYTYINIYTYNSCLKRAYSLLFIVNFKLENFLFKDLRSLGLFYRSINFGTEETEEKLSLYAAQHKLSANCCIFAFLMLSIGKTIDILHIWMDLT